MPANPPTKQAARLPKANIEGPHGPFARLDDHYSVRIPVRTVTEARALILVAGFFAMGEGERVEMLAKKITAMADYECDTDVARALLTLIASGGARK